MRLGRELSAQDGRHRSFARLSHRDVLFTPPRTSRISKSQRDAVQISDELREFRHQYRASFLRWANQATRETGYR
ncbi:hypothetical protein OKW46_000946 [Paraburkholderia sp. WSM4179]|nr:hypothetical protein [Paraburkholderia sp. WSM4179]